MDMGYSRGRYDSARGDMEEMGSRRQPGGGRWSHQERRGQAEEFPNKRRRY